jgi:hypothetical protein
MKALVALVPTLVLFSGSAVLLSRTRTMAALLQLLGAACLVAVVLTHLCEAFDLFPGMGWGLPNSVGHYLDLGIRCSGSRCSRSATYGTPSQSGPDPCSPATYPARTSSDSCELSSASRGTSSRRLAAHMKDPEQKKQLEDMAQAWELLARARMKHLQRGWNEPPASK